MKPSLLILLSLLFCLSHSTTNAQTEEQTTFVRVSLLVPTVTIEKEITPHFSVIGGVGVGYYVRRRNHVLTSYYDKGELQSELLAYDEPLLRLNYPARLLIEQPTTEQEPSIMQGPVIHELIPYLDVEGRYYVNMGRRESLGKSIDNKSANYLCFNTAVYADGLVVFRGHYGLQRNVRRFWVDWSFGPTYSIGELDSGLFIIGLLKLGFRVN